MKRVEGTLMSFFLSEASLILLFGGFFIIGLGIGYFTSSVQKGKIRKSLLSLTEENTTLRIRVTELSTLLQKDQESWKEKIYLLQQTEERLKTTFDSLSSKALHANNTSFLTLAQTILEKFHEKSQTDLSTRQKAISETLSPLKETLSLLDQKIQSLEQTRQGAYEGLKQQIQDLLLTQKELRQETSSLTKALRTPHVRGKWGELQLRRTVELAGMISHCDFVEQSTLPSSLEAKTMRPDLIVKLPGNKIIIIDAKAPLQAYLDSLDCKNDQERQEKLKEHARHVRGHIFKLSQKNYWDQFSETPEFVVLFLPGESFFSAALEQDPSLIETGADQKVILATPTTLIALLRAIHYGWRQERLTDNARKISELGRDLYKRLGGMTHHFFKLGKSIHSSVEAYNQTVGSFESRVLPAAKRFEELDSSPSKDDLIISLNTIDATPRSILNSYIVEKKEKTAI